MISRSEPILERLELFGVRLGLETTRQLLEGLGRPQERFASVLVAGTNGKGSTAAVLASILTAAGYRTGLYTSPHLEQVEERIRIDGVSIEDAALAERLEAVVGLAEKGGAPPTYFEALTVAAVDHFARADVEAAVLEVGMGGRLDATNAVDPTLSLITEISLDHAEHLGADPATIAREKAGILRRGRPAVAARQSGSQGALVTRALAEEADRCGAALELLEATVEVVDSRDPADTRRVAVETLRGRRELEFRLAGGHQLANLALAVRGAEVLAAEGFGRIDEGSIREGVARCRWPGRLERIEIPGGRSVLLDAAHNPSGTARLVEYLQEIGEPFDLLFGALADKPVGEMLPPLVDRARRVYLAQPESARARPVEELAPFAGDRRVADEATAPGELLARALAEREGPLLVASGSIYLIGEIRSRLREISGRPAPAVAPLY